MLKYMQSLTFITQNNKISENNKYQTYEIYCSSSNKNKHIKWNRIRKTHPNFCRESQAKTKLNKILGCTWQEKTVAEQVLLSAVDEVQEMISQVHHYIIIWNE